jgi:predicted dehydrogenase
LVNWVFKSQFTNLPVTNFPLIMKFLIAGFGSIGRRHFRNLLTLGERDIVFLRSKRSTLPDDEIAEFPVETEIQAALAHQPDAVIIATPTALHLDIAIPAARQGCHLFIEKPISHSLERVDEFQAALASGGGKAFTAFQFRFHPGLRKIKELLAKEVIDRPISVRVHWGEYLPGWHPWEDYRQGYSARADLGGGVVLTLCHPLDYLRWLFGEVVSLWAFVSANSDLKLDVEDTAEIGLRFESGLIGSVHLDYVQCPPGHHLEIIGSEGTIRWDNADGVVAVYDTQDGDWQHYPIPNDFERNDMFLAEMRHFLEVVHGEAEPICNLDDGIWSLKLALGVHVSAAQGKLITWGTEATSGLDGNKLPMDIGRVC